MPEVKRYHVTEAGLVESLSLGRINVVLGADFDNATRLFLDAAERSVAAERREKELQQRLTAADERVDVLEGLFAERNEFIKELIDEAGYDWLSTKAVEKMKSFIYTLKPTKGANDERTSPVLCCDGSGCGCCVDISDMNQSFS